MSVDIELLVVPDCPHEAPALAVIEAYGVPTIGSVIATVTEPPPRTARR